jgi:excisionase family DNA binding protein
MPNRSAGQETSRDHNEQPAVSEERRSRSALEADVLGPLVDAIPALMDEHALLELARRLQPLLAAREQPYELPSEDLLLTCSEAALHARVHVETIRRAVRSGLIPVAARIGRSPRISHSALDSWLAATTAHSTRPDQETRVRPRAPRPGHAGSLRDVWS